MPKDDGGIESLRLLWRVTLPVADPATIAVSSLSVVKQLSTMFSRAPTSHCGACGLRSVSTILSSGRLKRMPSVRIVSAQNDSGCSTVQRCADR